MALMVVKTCQKIDGGLPATLRARMMFNIALDFGLGLIPLLGDIADAVFRANTRNAWLLEMYLTKKMEAERVGHVSDPELGKINVPTHPGAIQPAGKQQAANPHSGQQQGVIMNQPEPARVHARPQPVRVQPGSRYGIPISTNGKIRRPDGETTMAALDHGVRTLSSGGNVREGYGGGRGRGQTPTGRSMPRTKEGLAVAALQYGARAALDAHSNARSKSSGQR